MGKRQAIKNIKRVSCRFDMDVPEERRAWQILQGNYQEPPEGKKQDYTSIIAKAMIGYYDRKEENHLTHEELLAKIQESIQREAAEIKKSFPQTPYPMMYPYMPMAMPGMQTETVKTEKAEQVETQTKMPETEELNEAALDFMDSFMGG
ncbi:hypothetical protein [Parablautia intestinalis]|uniref:hypothetical protein n=1 Tax=Parablautia intestinalis TaxID=2320100 RepID=UPI00256F54BA|nr:hypothetical protein [Parablautia intestinalis]